MNTGDIRIRVDGNNISMIQPDPITGALNWIVINEKYLKAVIETLAELEKTL
jgi:hypothetical protein